MAKNDAPKKPERLREAAATSKIAKEDLDRLIKEAQRSEENAAVVDEDDDEEVKKP